MNMIKNNGIIKSNYFSRFSPSPDRVPAAAGSCPKQY